MTTPPGGFAAALRAWRNARRITQEEAATILAVSLHTYRGWEGGRRCDHEGAFRKLLALLPPITPAE